MLAKNEPARFVHQLDAYQAIFWRRRRAKPRRPPQANTKPGRPAPAMGPGTETSITPVLPLINTSAMKRTPAEFAWVRSAIVALLTVNVIAVIPELVPVHVEHCIPKPKFPNSGWPFTLNDPATPLSTGTGGAGVALTMSAASTPVPLNANNTEGWLDCCRLL